MPNLNSLQICHVQQKLTKTEKNSKSRKLICHYFTDEEETYIKVLKDKISQ